MLSQLHCRPDNHHRLQRGFTLLEMMVVLVLVGMISAMLMQGFIYVAGIFSSVERRQQHWQQQMLQRTWLQESVRSLTNGVEGSLAQPYFFNGDEQGFTGLALHGLSYAGGVGRPLRVQWQLEHDDEHGLRLLYREIKLHQSVANADDNPWYTVARWPRAQGEFRYFSQSGWYPRFSGRPLPDQANPVLPDMILLNIDAGPRSMEIWVATAASSLAYEPPGDSSGTL